MMRQRHIRLHSFGVAVFVTLGALALSATNPSLAAEKVKVAVFPAVSALPYYVARERGLFAAEGIEAEQIVFQSHPLIFQALITGDADAASNTVTLEGANINLKRPGTAYFFALNAQNATWRGEVVVAREGFAGNAIKDFKGKGVKILCAPGPANREAARAVFAANGLVEGTDFTIAELQMGDHIGALKAGTFDAGYTLEPFAHIMEKQGVARVLESGVIAKYIVGKPDGFVPAAGGVVAGKFLETRPTVAAALAKAWSKAIDMIGSDPSVRDLLAKFMNTPAALAPTVPLVGFAMVRELKPADIGDFQKFVDFAVAKGMLSGPFDVRTMLKPL
jgi:NitT/TauT family transport system substrate-binding protein